MPSMDYELDKIKGEDPDPDPEWFPADKPSSPLTTVVDGAGDIRAMTGVIAPPERTLIYLDPDDPFDRALIPIVEVSHRKRADYVTDSAGPFDNFRITAAWAGFEAPYVSSLFNCSQKMARIQALRANGRTANTRSEPLEDSLLDLATYAILAYAMFLQDKENDGS